MAETKFTPCIILPGIGQSKVELVDENGAKIKMAWPLDFNTDNLMSDLKGPLMKMMLFRKDGAFLAACEKLIKEAADPVATNPDGSMKNTVRVVEYPQSLAACTPDERRYVYKMVPMDKLSAVIGDENIYFFAYNSFGDTYEMAAHLDGFIQQVKAETGSEKVNLIPVSMGGALSTAYFDAYGYKNDVKRVMYMVAALEGSSLIADIMLGRIVPENGLSALELLTNRSTAEKAAPLIKMLPEGTPERLLHTCLDALIDTALRNSPSIWSIIPPQYYEELAAKYIPEGTALREKTDRYYNAQKNLRSIINGLRANGTEFFACCGYGMQLFELSASSSLSSDTIIELSSTSLGAESAPRGETLNREGEYISPDKTVDASTGFFPETTWYFKGQQHDAIAYNDTALEVAKRVLSDDSFVSVHSDETLARFGEASDNRK